MDDLLDRLAVLSPGPSHEVDLAVVRRRADVRRRRRSGLLGVAGISAAVVLLAGALAGMRLLEESSPREITAAGRPSTVPASWGGPIDLLAGDGELFVQLDEMVGEDPGAGIARLDPVSGDLAPVAAIDSSSTVAYGAGSLWTLSARTHVLRRLDPSTGEERDRVALLGLHDGGYRVAVGLDTVWLFAYDDAPTELVDVSTGAQRRGRRLGDTSSEPVVVDDDAYVGTPDGLRRVAADGEVDALLPSGPVTALATADHRLWVATGDSAWLQSSLGHLDPDEAEPPVLGDQAFDGTISSVGVTDDRVCAAFDGALSNPVLRCGPAPRLGDRLAVDATRRVVSGFAGSPLVAFDGSLWTTSWGDGLVRRVDPATARSTTLVDLPFDGQRLIEASKRRIGPEREVMSGSFPDGLGRWRLFAYETSSSICTSFESARGGSGGCWEPPPAAAVLSVGYSAGGGNQGLPLDAEAAVLPEVDLVRFELSNGGVVEVEPVDVGLPLDFVYTQLPDGIGVTRAVALGADGAVLDTAEGFVPVD